MLIVLFIQEAIKGLGFYFFDHSVASQMAQQKEFNLKNPSAYHYDILLLGFMTLLCGLIGLPPSNGVIPQPPMHTKSLAALKRQLPSRSSSGRDSTGHTGNAADRSSIGTIFSTTDTVCTLQVLHQDETPLLYSLVFSLSSASMVLCLVLEICYQNMKVGTSSPKREGGTQIAQINNAPKVSGGSPHYNNGSIHSTSNLKGIMQSSSVSSPSSGLGRSTTLKKLSASKSDQDLASLRSPHFGVFL
ncbi:Boron transporter 4 [Camellia lanceoleosa]|uniref:Boron transporter 4 n=1 Tax=Camellia lanceoleosa TaxID=1840588 RepID=A0ACC0IJY4_9ERIC|nr:Boron transporter 4 [Camellia lanceoleosa]